jgi:hypothetical protein
MENGNTTSCPECAARNVRVTLRSADAVYYCWEKCEHLWSVPTRGGRDRDSREW